MHGVWCAVLPVSHWMSFRKHHPKVEWLGVPGNSFDGLIRITGRFRFVLEENSEREITWLSLCDRFGEAPFSKWFLFTRKGKAISGAVLVSSAAVIRVVTQRFSPTSGEDRCVTTLRTAAKETSAVWTWPNRTVWHRLKFTGILKGEENQLCQHFNS